MKVNNFYPELFDWMIKKLKVKRFLDVGCETGISSKYFIDKGCFALGIDISKNLLCYPINFVESDLNNSYVLLDSISDMAWCSNKSVSVSQLSNLIKTLHYTNKIAISFDTFKEEDFVNIMKKNRFEYNKELTMEARSQIQHQCLFKDKGMIFERKASKTKYFGIGFGKCGTSSLCEAMSLLGFRSIHCPNIFQLQEIDQYDFANDMPIFKRFKDIDRRFPNSKFIYNYRKVDDFLHSAETHWKKEEKEFIKKQKHPWEDHIKERILEAYGDLYFNYKMFKENFTYHEREVVEHFKNRSGDILFINICEGEGWEKLVPFTKSEIIPTIPFPYKNKINELL